MLKLARGPKPPLVFILQKFAGGQKRKEVYPMYTKNLTLKESLKTLKTLSADPCELTLEGIFAYGLRFANDAFAIIALQELNRRGASDIIVKHLHAEIDSGHIVAGSVFATTLVNTLCELDRTTDPFLCSYGKALRDNGVFISPIVWIKNNAKRYQCFHRSGMLQNAKPWVKKYLVLEKNHHNEDDTISNRNTVVPEETDDE